MPAVTLSSVEMVLVQKMVLCAHTGLTSLDYRWGFN